MNSMEKLYKENKKLNSKLEWFNLFVDYIQHCNRNLYNSACKYADNEYLTDNGLSVEEVKEYYLNTGFPEYEEEPYTSYTDEDWIEHANANDLER